MGISYNLLTLNFFLRSITPLAARSHRQMDEYHKKLKKTKINENAPNEMTL